MRSVLTTFISVTLLSAGAALAGQTGRDLTVGNYSNQIANIAAVDLTLLPPTDSAPRIMPVRQETSHDVPVEAIPAPSAMASGLLVLGGLAAFRLFRRIRFA